MRKPAVKPAAAASAEDRGSGDAAGDEGWRVLLLRALVTGDVELLARAMESHIDVLSLPFTKCMPDWKVQWESLYWKVLPWMLRDATPLFIAAAYAHPELVHWLLLRGADRTSKCYLNRTPLDFVGECSETTMTKSAETPMASVLARSEACRTLLTAAPALPAPPLDGVRFTCHISSQVVVVKAPPSSSSSSSNRPNAASPMLTQQTIYKCLLEVEWEAPLSNGALIEKYEIRHRLVAESGDEGGGGASGSWRIERCPHNRKARDQRILIEGLQFGSTYELMLRSWNAAGKGDWGRAYQCPTLVSPEQAARN